MSAPDASGEPDRLDDATVHRFMTAERPDFLWDDDAGAWIPRLGGVAISLEAARKEAAAALAAAVQHGSVPNWLDSE